MILCDILLETKDLPKYMSTYFIIINRFILTMLKIRSSSVKQSWKTECIDRSGIYIHPTTPSLAGCDTRLNLSRLKQVWIQRLPSPIRVALPSLSHYSHIAGNWCIVAQWNANQLVQDMNSGGRFHFLTNMLSAPPQAKHKARYMWHLLWIKLSLNRLCCLLLLSAWSGYVMTFLFLSLLIATNPNKSL